ncbi:MAG: flippase [Caldilinea sp. CFX5]|nr:flippase [Caldilinea sp. CFX5]
MNQSTKNIAKNASVLLGAQIIMWFLTMAMTIVLPRYLGAAGVGKMQFATSLWLVIGVIAAFGIDTLLTKEIARDPTRTPVLFGSALVLRCLLYALGYVALVATLRFFAYPEDTINIVCLVGVANLIRQLIAMTQATLQGLERMAIFSFGEILSNALYTMIGILLLFYGWGLYAIVGLMIVTVTINLLIQLYFLNGIYRLRPNFAWPNLQYLLQTGWPYLLSSFFLVAYMQVDIIIISALVDERAIGWYSAAYRLFGTFLFIPTVYIMAAFPVFSRMFVNDQSGLQRLISKSFDTLFLLSVPLGFGMTIIANPLVALIFGPEFVNSGPILGVLGVILILTYQNILIGHFLISMDRQNIWTLVMVIATIATVPLDLLLIPWCETRFGNGALGGALAFGITELGMLLVGLKLLPTGALTRTNLWTATRILMAGALMMAVVWQFEHLFIAIPILLGVISYLALVIALRIIPRKDFELLHGFVQPLVGRLRRVQPEVVNS